MNNHDSPIKKVIIFGSIGFIILVGSIVGIFYSIQINDRHKQNAVFFSNLDECSQNMQSVIKDSMRTTMYATIKAANDYNKKDSSPNYDVVIREGSCKEDEEQVSEVGGVTTLKRTTAILDIEAAQQSWRIEYNWLPNGTDITVDLGTVIVPSCLDEKDLLYGDFNCEKIMSLQEYGTDKVDPILAYMPYTGKGFNLAYDPDTRTITAEIEVRESQKDNKVLINNIKKQVIQWFASRSLDEKNYTITYKTKIISSPSYL